MEPKESELAVGRGRPRGRKSTGRPVGRPASRGSDRGARGRDGGAKGSDRGTGVSRSRSRGGSRGRGRGRGQGVRVGRDDEERVRGLVAEKSSRVKTKVMACALSGECQAKLAVVFENAAEGTNSLLDFINALHTFQSSRNTDLKSIQTLLPKLEMSKGNFDRMIRNLGDILQIVNKKLETSVVQIKDKNDKLALKNIKLSKLQESLTAKEKDVTKSKIHYKDKLNDLSTAENDLSSAKEKLENAKKKQRDMQIAGGVLQIVPILGNIIGTTLLVVSFTAEQAHVDLTENVVKSAESIVEDSNNRLKRAIDSRQVVQNELNALKGEQVCLNKEIHLLNEDKCNLKRYQEYVIELDEKMKNTYHGVSNFHGRFKVLYCETKGAYSISALSGPIATVLTSMSELIDSTTTQIIVETTHTVGLGDRIRQMEQLEWISNQDDNENIDYLY